MAQTQADRGQQPGQGQARPGAFRAWSTLFRRTARRGLLRAGLSVGLTLVVVSIVPPAAATEAPARTKKKKKARKTKKRRGKSKRKAPVPVVVPDTVVEQKRSAYAEVFVTEGAGRRTLRFGAADGEEQTVLDMAEPGKLVLEYTRDMAAAMDDAPEGDALLLGLGGGALAHAWRARRKTPVVAVEIDPVVSEMATRHFRLDDAAPVEVLNDDAFAMVQAWARRSPPARTFSYVAIDVYGTGDGPRYLRSETFFAMIRSLLVPGGVVTVNLAMPKIKARKVERMLLRAFGACSAVVGRKDGNVVLIAKDTPRVEEDAATRLANRDRGPDLAMRCERAQPSSQPASP